MTKKSQEQPPKEEMPEGIREAYAKAVRKKLDGNGEEPQKTEQNSLEQRAHSFKYDKTKEGWTLEKDTFEEGPVNFEDLEIIGVPAGAGTLEQGLAGFDANLGQKTAEWLLENQDKIPQELQGKFLCFPGTQWWFSGSNRVVPHLYLFGERWRLGCLSPVGGVVSNRRAYATS